MSTITLRNLHEHTHLEIVQFVESALWKQSKKSISPSGRCLYRRKTDGAKCAIGHLIPDEDYQTNFEQGTPDYVVSMLGIDVAEFTLNLLNKLQHIHDNLKMQNWAFEFGLLEEDAKAGLTMTERYWAGE